MLIYDIHSFPAGLTVDAWLDLYNKGIVIFDSHLNGAVPLKYDNEQLHLIDISSIDPDDLKFVMSIAAEIIKEDDETRKRQREIFRENNQKLIQYLKSINDETI